VTLRVGLLLPAAAPPDWQIEQRLEGIRVRFGRDASVALLAAHDSVVPDAAFLAAAIPVSVDEAHPEMTDHIVAFDEDSPSRTRTLASHTVSEVGRVVPWPDQPITDQDYAGLSRHVFNRLGPIGQGELDYYSFQYFPYGYLFRIVGLGPTDPFGHRIEGDLRAWRERGETRLVACFGGSAVWGTTTLPHQCFPDRLEHMLNDTLPSSFSRYKVLNFGVPGGVLLNSIQRFILFCAELKPDIVILHDGINDMFYGSSSDATLLSKYDISYQNNLETWAQILHAGSSARSSHTADRASETRAAASPISVLKAYLRRKRELAAVCRTFGAKVVTGLQPYCGSKHALSPTEMRRIRKWAGEPNIYANEFAMIAGLYRIIGEEKPPLGGDVHLDFHEEFARFGSSDTLFCDMVHLNRDGEHEIALRYADAIRRLDIGQGRDANQSPS
jgi:lysophospholipase L1-like esterase